MINRLTQMKWILALLCLMCSSVGVVHSEDFVENDKTLQIIASIKPLALLVQEIVGEDASVQVLLEANQNHHIAQLKPSQREKVAQAHLVFFINDNFESFVKNIRDSDSDKEKYIQVSDIPGLRLLSIRKSGQMPHTVHAESLTKMQIQQRVFQSHNHGGVDWHIWLNPDNAIVILMKIRDELTKLNPENELAYQQRFEDFSQRLVKDSAENAKMIMELFNKPFFVLHDGLQYFEEQYGLQSKGIILENEGSSMSARHLINLRKIRDEEKVDIVLKDEQFSNRMIDTLAGKRPFTVVTVDSLAQGSFSEIDNFLDYYDAIANQVFLALKP